MTFSRRLVIAAGAALMAGSLLSGAQAQEKPPVRIGALLPLSGAGHELDHLATVINNLLGRIAQYVGEHRGLMADAAANRPSNRRAPTPRPCQSGCTATVRSIRLWSN